MDDTVSQKEEKGFDNEPIHWENIIFLPFNFKWRCLVFLSVISKCVLGPFISLNKIHCSTEMDKNDFLYIVKSFYIFIADPIYIIDTFLYMLHRQVTDTAVMREHLPKPLFFICLDMLALIPFFRLMTSQSCPAIQLWPNILAFNEMLIVYRIIDYFSLTKAPSPLNLILGYGIMLILYINTLTCFLLLLTEEGFCDRCVRDILDWRSFILDMLNGTETNTVTVYLYGSALSLALTVHKLIYDAKPNTYLEYIISISIMALGYSLVTFVMLPKLFSETISKMRRRYIFGIRVQRLIEETKRKNPSPIAHKSVEKFYSLIWNHRSGITSMPDSIHELPISLKINVIQNLVFPVFYHSPTLRNTSLPFKRWLCTRIQLDYKLPGEKFFVGPHSKTSIFFIKSGTVQLLSTEDNLTPILSVTGGTVFGDVNFLFPPLNREVVIRCLTYCEVFSVPRAQLLKSLHRFPQDRRDIIDAAKERLKHAQNLHSCKNNVRGLDRVEDEGIAWIKRRWWEINENVRNMKKTKTPDSKLPAEEMTYHCVKYLGQLALDTDVKSHSKSLFVKVKLPWILKETSIFGDIWNSIVTITVTLVLLMLPPVILIIDSETEISRWVTMFLYCTDFIYIADILVSLLTAMQVRGVLITDFSAIMFARFKQLYFLLDVMSVNWIGSFLNYVGYSKYYGIGQYTRLLKTYMLFFDKYKRKWRIDDDSLERAVFVVGLTNFWFVYVLGHFVFMILKFIPELSPKYFFGEACVFNENIKSETEKRCKLFPSILDVLIGWVFQLIFPEQLPHTLSDVIAGIIIVAVFFLMHEYTKTKLLSCIYMKNRQTANYIFLVTNLKSQYVVHQLQSNQLKQLNDYLMCHWNYYHGMDILYPNVLKDVPYDIFWKLHGEAAMKLIGESDPFKGANAAFIREMAQKAKFTIVPKDFIFHSDTINWISNGIVKVEFFDENGKTTTTFCRRGRILTLLTILLKKAMFRTYTTATDCEILILQVKDFYDIKKRYPNEEIILETCLTEVLPGLENHHQAYMKKHRDRLKHEFTLKNQVSNEKMNLRKKTKTDNFCKRTKAAIISFFKDYRKNPESRFIRCWMVLRIVVIFLSISSSALQGGSGAIMRPFLIGIKSLCDVVTIIDIGLKLFLPYYNHKGLIMSSFYKCWAHYLTRGFILDVIGGLPWDIILTEITEGLSQNGVMLIDTLSRFSHLYLIIGFFNYISDKPTMRTTTLMILKWEIVNTLIMFGTSHFLVYKCIEFQWDDDFHLVNMTKKPSCWCPKFIRLDQNPTITQLHYIFAESLILTQCGFLMTNLGLFNISNYIRLESSICFLLIASVFWYLRLVSLSLLILNLRGSSLFQHGVSQLKKFLSEERVDKNVIERAVKHFIYIWTRTKGVALGNLMFDRTGTVFKQDVSYYFYKRTYAAVDTLLGGGESLEQMMASHTLLCHYLKGEDVIREMELSPYVYILHRGQVAVSKDGEDLAKLTKGSIFGQLEGSKMRPVRIRVCCVENSDFLYMTTKQFQEIINDDIRENIADNPQAKNDFMAIKKLVVENPYNTLKYILRERKSIKLPNMPKPVSAENSKWYMIWLCVAWLCGPIISAIIVLFIESIPESSDPTTMYILSFLDVLHAAYLVSEFYTMEVVVIDNTCVKKYLGFRAFYRGWFFIDLLSLLVPYLTYFTDNTNYQLARLLRIHYVKLFQTLFSQSFKSGSITILVKFLTFLMILHTLTCGWIYIACNSDKDYVAITKLSLNLPSTIDADQWISLDLRENGCLRIAKLENDTIIFAVAKNWEVDYVIALTYIVTIYTRTNMDFVVPLTLTEIYYKVFVTIVLYVCEVWIIATFVSAVVTKYRERSIFGHRVSNLLKYLEHNGLAGIFLHEVKKYTTLLWQRQKGNWLPDITQLAPICLRQDIMSALYIHHFESQSLFKNLPRYFLRQLSARLNRVVIFPGAYVIKEGDIIPRIYFIHEGEVERWHTETNGDFRMLMVLKTNEHFGIIPGLFPELPFKYSYFARTVVDLVYLSFGNWQDLLNCYPDVKQTIYSEANKLRAIK